MNCPECDHPMSKRGAIFPFFGGMAQRYRCEDHPREDMLDVAITRNLAGNLHKFTTTIKVKE